MSSLPVKVRLSKAEMLTAVIVGANRRVTDIDLGRVPRQDSDRVYNHWDHEIEGACAEAALSKFLNLRWSGMSGVPGDPDVGIGEEVRQTSRHKHRLSGRLMATTPVSRTRLMLDGWDGLSCMISDGSLRGWATHLPPPNSATSPRLWSVWRGRRNDSKSSA